MEVIVNKPHSSKLYYCSDFCYLCLAHNKTITSQNSIGSRAQEILECIIPEYILQNIEMPNQICDECLNNLNKIFEFRQKCLENIISFSEYVKKLTKEYETNKCISVTLNDFLQQRNCKILNDEHRNDRCAVVAPNVKIKEEIEIFGMENQNKNEQKYVDKIEHVVIKSENTIDDFCVKKEINEELIIKEDSCFLKNSQDSLERRSEHSHNINQEDQHFPVTSSVINKNDSQSTADFNKQLIFRNLKQNKPINREEKSFTCDICGKIFSQIGKLNKHKRIHSDEKPYACDVCEKTFNENGNLKQHKRIHSGEKPFACDICQKTFKRFSVLQRHKRIHSGEKPYVCDICEKTFTDNGNLTKHKRIHSGEKPYACDLCQKTFNFFCNLNKHKRIHNGEKPYTCDICQRSFSQLCNLKTHKRTHNNDRSCSYDQDDSD